MTSMTRDEYSDAYEQQSRAKDHFGTAAHQLYILEQAEVSARSLTGHPAWDRYLSYVQAAVEDTKTYRAVLLEQLADPTVVNRDDILRLKFRLSECDSRILAWVTAMELPNEIIQNGEKAKNLLKELPEAGAA